MGGDVSFVLDKNKVDVAPERLRIDAAEYRGADDKGRPFKLHAGSAVQRSSAEPIVQLNDLSAEIRSTTGPPRSMPSAGTT
jgi:lipopolysaccharide export system protein LptC